MRGTEKYIVRQWTPYFREKRVRTLREAIILKKKWKNKKADYCQIIKISFAKRHPDFPLWFSIVTLFLVIFAPEVDSYIRHILQTMQLWK